jgi:dTDP-4-amino-4,6-dideoxygalactose transaminase
VSWRYLPPVHSPLSAGAVAAGLQAAITGDRGARERVERALAAFFGVTRVLLTASGTAALDLAMRWAMGATGRSRIALPGYCCYDLVTALRGAGADVVLYDIDPSTLGPDWRSLEAALEARPAALVAAHLYGLPVDMPRVMDLAERVGAIVLEDAAQGIGASLNGRPLGTFGHLRMLSFGRGKGVTAGKGGALLVAAGWRGSGEPSVGLKSSRGWGELFPLLGQWSLARPGLYRVPAGIPALALGETLYRDPVPPTTISAVGAAVVEQTWRTQADEPLRRRRTAARLTQLLEAASLFQTVVPIAGAEPGWLRYPILAPDITRTDSRMRASRALGVMPGYPRALETLPALPEPRPRLPLPGAARLAAELWTLPTHSLVAENDLERLGGWLAAMDQPEPSR